MCLFIAIEVSAQEINELLRQASTSELKGTLGYEDRPLVSADFVNDLRSGIVDGLSTLKLPNGQNRFGTITNTVMSIEWLSWLRKFLEACDETGMKLKTML